MELIVVVILLDGVLADGSVNMITSSLVITDALIWILKELFLIPKLSFMMHHM